MDFDQENPMYFTKLILIIKKYFFLIPLWTGIILNAKNKSFTRISNNNVENLFKIEKHDLLKNNLS